MKKISVFLLVVLVLIFSASICLAQLPHQDLAVSGFFSGGIQGGITHVGTSTPSSTAVSGLFCTDINSALYDPYSGDYVTGGITVVGGACMSSGEVRRLNMSGSTVLGEVVLATLSTGASVSGLDVGLNGHFIASNGSDVWQVDRLTGLATPLIMSPFTAIANAVEVSPGSSLVYVAVTGPTMNSPSFVYLIEHNGQATQLGTTSGVVTGNQFLSGLAVGPNEQELWVSGFGTPSLVKFDLSSPQNLPLPVTGVSVLAAALNDIEFHEGTQKFYACSASGALDLIWELDPSVSPPAVSQVSSFPAGSWGVSSWIAVNDLADVLTVFPETVDVSNPTTATFEIALHGPPGDLGVVGITAVNASPFFLVLGSGFFGSDGRLSLPPITASLDPSMAGSMLRFGSARFSGVSLGNLDFAAATVAFGDKHLHKFSLDDTILTKLPDEIVVGHNTANGRLFKIDNDGPDTVNVYRWDPLANNWDFLFDVTGGNGDQWTNNTGGATKFRIELKDSPIPLVIDEAKGTWNIN